MTVPALNWLNSNLDGGEQLFEWGSGASTFWFANRVAQVYSAEYFEAFYYYIKEYAESKGYENVDLILAKPDVIPQEGYIAKYSSAAGQSFKRFCLSIENYPSSSFDVVVIDGRARTRCLDLAMRAVKRGGLIIFDDTERVEYRASLNKYISSFAFIKDFKGEKATTGKISQTSIARVS
jgi:predicted O-methyltransferase YrrM